MRVHHHPTYCTVTYLPDSSYLPGLVHVLKKLTSSECITTIIPGRLYRTSSNTKSQLQLRFTTSVENTSSTSKSRPKDNSTKYAALSSKHMVEDSSAEGEDHPSLHECKSYSVTQKVIARKSSMMQEVITAVTLFGELSTSRVPNRVFTFDLQVFLVYPTQTTPDFDLAHHVQTLLLKEACTVGEFH